MSQAGMDEYAYGHCAARMVRTGHWATPMFLDRYALNKPPLLMWAGAASMRVFGVNAIALRLPPVLAAIAAVMLIYLWLRRGRGPAAALAGALLLCSDPLFHALARTFMTDIFLTSACVAAVSVLMWDQRLERRWSGTLFGLFTGCAILSKSAAGLLPLVMLACFWLLMDRADRPRSSGIAAACGAAAAVSAPWHLYQFLVHKDWFVTEYLLVQLVSVGVKEPPSWGTSPLAFYSEAIWKVDPVLVVLSLSALPWLAIAAWKRDDKDTIPARLLAAWLIAASAGLAAFGNHAAYYSLPLLAGLAVTAAQFSPAFRGRIAWVTLAILLSVFGVKAYRRSPVWALNYGPGVEIPAAPALDNYATARRTNELVMVQPNDEFHSSILDLPRVRYVIIQKAVDTTKTPSFFYWLGTIMPAGEFLDLPSSSRRYEARLRAWNCPYMTSIATVIVASSEAEVAAVIQASPERDFSLPESMRPLAAAAGGATHTAGRAEAGRFFLLANSSGRRESGMMMPGTLVARGQYTQPPTPE